MVYAQPSICPGEWDISTPMGFWHTNRSHNLGQTTRPYINQQKKRTCKIVDFAVAADHRKKLKENEKKKYLELARKLKKLWNVKVTIIPIVIGAFGTVTKGLLKGLEDFEMRGRVETIQITSLLRMGRILRRVLETWGDLLSLILQWKPNSINWCENSQGLDNNNNNNNNNNNKKKKKKKKKQKKKKKGKRKRKRGKRKQEGKGKNRKETR